MAWELFENIKGPKGDDGKPGTISSVSAETVAEGAPARAFLSGTDDVHVHFELPRGAKGERGPAGVASSAAAQTVPYTDPAEVILEQHGESVHAKFKIPEGAPGTNAVPTAEAIRQNLASPNSVARGGLETGMAEIGANPNSAFAQAQKQKLDAGLAVKANQAEMLERFLRRSASPEEFGAIGNGTTDDTAAFQAAVDAVSPGGTVVCSSRSTYKLDGAVILKTGVTIEGNGATVTKGSTATGSVTFANQMYAKGYGGGGRDITIRNLRTLGDYALTGPGRDQIMSFMHISGLRIENCVFEQGMVNGHYLDLMGCDDVRVLNCTFKGMNPVAGREIIEAIQVDSSTYSGAGHPYFGMNHFDGLPTRNVRVTGCTFTTLTLGSTEYPMPNPLGTHNGALVGEDGWYQDIFFERNLVRGWTVDVVGNYWQGWIHLPGFRNVTIQGNTFAYTGPARSGGRGSIIVSRPLGEVIPLAQVAASAPGKTPLGSPRSAMNWKISDNVFTGFGNNFSDSASALIYMDAAGNDRISITGNVSDAAKCGFCRIDNDVNLMISNNTAEASGSNPVIDVRNATAVIQGNSLRAATAFGILITGGKHHVVEANRVNGGGTAIRAIGIDNGIIANNFLRDYATLGIELGANGDALTSFDVTISGNRLTTSSAEVIASIRTGTKSTRAFRFGNRYRDGGPTSDAGTGTLATSALDTN